MNKMNMAKATNTITEQRFQLEHPLQTTKIGTLIYKIKMKYIYHHY